MELTAEKAQEIYDRAQENLQIRAAQLPQDRVACVLLGMQVMIQAVVQEAQAEAESAEEPAEEPEPANGPATDEDIDRLVESVNSQKE